MDFMQLASNPGSGIPDTDSYCFGRRMPVPHTNGGVLYTFRVHKYSNGNQGGWKVDRARVTPFKLILTF
jgi:hypothetical protein